MRHAVARAALPLLLLAYLFGGLLTHNALGGREVFPLFSWSLFSDVPARATRYTARIRALDGRLLSPPADIETTAAFHRLWDCVQAEGIIQRLGTALATGSHDQARPLRRSLEANVLPPGEVRYDIVRLAYRPLDGRPGATETTIGSFVKPAAPRDSPR